MGFLNRFSKSAPPLTRLPVGTFTVDRTGRVVIGTISSNVPAETVQKIGRCVLQTFREAQEAHLPLSELIVNYGSLKVISRELRGGAIVFLTPLNPTTPTK